MLNPALNLNSVNALAIYAEELKIVLQRERSNTASLLSVIPNDLILYYITPYVFNGPYLQDNLLPMRNIQEIKDLTQERKVVKEQISFRSFDKSAFQANELGLGLLGMSLIIGGGIALLHPIPTEVSLSFLAVGLVTMSHVSHNYRTRLTEEDQTEETQLNYRIAKYSDLRTKIIHLRSEDKATNKGNYKKISVKVVEEIIKDLNDLNALFLDTENKEDELILQKKCLITNKIVTNLKQLWKIEVLSLNYTHIWTYSHVDYYKNLWINNKDLIELKSLDLDIKTISHIEQVINGPPLL